MFLGNQGAQGKQASATGIYKIRAKMLTATCSNASIIPNFDLLVLAKKNKSLFKIYKWFAFYKIGTLHKNQHGQTLDYSIN